MPKPSIPSPSPVASKAQQSYLEILFADLTFSRAARNMYLTDTVGREIRYLDELTVGEASRVIEQLKDQKERKFFGDMDGYAHEDDIPF